MLKFVKQHMESIAGIEIYPLISFVIFFTFFVLMIVYLIKADKNRMKKIATLPLDDQPFNTTDHEKE